MAFKTYSNGLIVSVKKLKNQESTWKLLEPIWRNLLLPRSPQLKKGQIVILDNTSIHKSKEVREIIEKAGCHLVFQPPYSPDLNPIEHIWAHKNKIFNLI